ncbi:hypothetical protein FHG87_012022 [Trinorchestia longiramus]|nr:hypothetical protein FHG87_012022 [Trinorchestia longiramus]
MEKVQRRATKMIPELCNLSCERRLEQLSNTNFPFAFCTHAASYRLLEGKRQACSACTHDDTHLIAMNQSNKTTRRRYPAPYKLKIMVDN